jgi:hypothetical protein
MKPPEHPSDNGTVMAALRERRDRAQARKMTVQNQIVRGELVDRDVAKGTLGRISGAWRGTVFEHAYTTVPLIMALLKINDSAADARLRLWFDDEICLTGGRVNCAMKKRIQSQKVDDGE